MLSKKNIIIVSVVVVVVVALAIGLGLGLGLKKTDDGPPPPDPCESSLDCKQGFVCSQNKCVANGGKCIISRDCPADKVCLDFTCQDKPECVLSMDCSAGKVCDNGKCVTP